ncbi:DNA repair protein RecO [Novispirillum itersonii]|uniref:DNA repair protein RecO n=1 Tax=Novispirillum itersonii TaxID=189 RepID=A0A7X0DLL4_NOVIT|nr:DNA repair protein RecO [Novispirillum itersonii]MBB6210091.1 DNA repair protein RecO (recombination protein O) [Novispirillum itersonii]
MEWRDAGIVLRVRRHGEAHVVASLLTASHGRQSGLIKGGASRNRRGQLEPGTIGVATWQARLEDQLGSLSFEPLEATAPDLLSDPDRLFALSSACAMLEATASERMPVPELYDATLALLAALRDGAPLEVYVRWELALLSGLGFGLDLGVCAVSGSAEDLQYVSPRTGRAVSAAAAGVYRDRLLPLPEFLRPGRNETPADALMLEQGLTLTGFFLVRHALLPVRQTRPGLPEARTLLLSRLQRLAERGVKEMTLPD